MTNYNDGKWHGWNGGECPVHPEVLVQAAYADGGGPPTMRAGELSWTSGEGDIVAFRVIREPRECWSYGAITRDTEADAIAFRKAVADANPGEGYEDDPITKWVEVLP